MTFQEACSACADIYELVPGTWTRAEFGIDGRRCSIGGLVHITGKQHYRSYVRSLKPFARQLGFEGAFDANDAGRLVAIKMLRMAAGEL